VGRVIRCRSQPGGRVGRQEARGQLGACKDDRVAARQLDRFVEEVEHRVRIQALRLDVRAVTWHLLLSGGSLAAGKGRVGRKIHYLTTECKILTEQLENTCFACNSFT